MAGSAVEISVRDKEMQALFSRIERNLKDLTPAMKIVGATVRTSVIRNFERSGRPRRWKKHAASTAARRGKSAKILMVQGLGAGLAGSIHYTAKSDRVHVGTNKIYAAVHQFGAAKGSFGTFVANVREHMRKGRQVRTHTRKMALPWGDIPARPFLMVQNEDRIEIRAALSDHIIRGR